MARRRLGARRGGGGVRLALGAVVAVALAVAAIALLRAQRQESQALRLEAAGDDAIAAGGRVGGGLFDGVDRFADRVADTWRSGERIAALERENAELKEWKQLALALSERMGRYEALLRMPPEALGQGSDVKGAVSARLILDPGGSFKRTLLANAGADHGVRPGYVALNENGLIGRVLSVGRRSARVLLLDDYNSRVPVMGELSRTRALLVGRAGQSPRLDGGPLTLTDARLDYPVGASGLRKGERVITSGDGGVYPRGLLVGWAEPAGEGRWTVKLSAAAAAIDFVRLIPAFDPQSPEAAPAPQQALPGPPQALVAAAASGAAPPLAPPAAPAPAPAKPKPVPANAPPGAPAGADEEEADAPPPAAEAGRTGGGP